jgi:PAS domain S-box-containing protein
MNPTGKILIAEGDPTALAATRRALRSAGYALFEAASGEAALQIVREHLPDLALLNVHLPDMDGFDACRRIKTEAASNSPFVTILIGSHISEDDRVKGLEFGADDYIVYPISNRELLARVKAMLHIRAAEQAAKACALQWRVTFDAVADAILLTDADFTILECNCAAAQVFGVSKAKIVGQKCYQYVHRTQQPIPKCPLKEAFASKQRQTLVLEDAGRWLQISIDPVLGADGRVIGSVHVISDITGRKQAEMALRQRAEELAALETVGRQVNQTLSLEQTIATALTEMVRAVQPDAAFFFIRDGERLLLKAIEPASRRAQMVSAPEHRVGKCLCGLAVQKGQAIYSRDIFSDPRCTWEECKRAGVRSFAALPLWGGEGVFGALGLSANQERDFEAQSTFLETLTSEISIGIRNTLLYERVQQHANELELWVAERTIQLREAQAQLVRQEKLAVMGQLAGSVGHELRNPLSVINNAVYFLKLIQPAADEKIIEYLTMIQNETRNAEKIINDLLDFARVKSADRQPVAVGDLIQHILLRHPAPEGVRVTVDLPANLPAAYVDPHQMGQVLSNLVLNAYQAMPAGGELTAYARRQADEIAITIQDTGEGISPENMGQLFEPLFTTKPKGIGLGLAVSKKLVEANAGRIAAQSQVGKGSAFTINLPIHRATA